MCVCVCVCVLCTLTPLLYCASASYSCITQAHTINYTMTVDNRVKNAHGGRNLCTQSDRLMEKGSFLSRNVVATKEMPWNKACGRPQESLNVNRVDCDCHRYDCTKGIIIVLKTLTQFALRGTPELSALTASDLLKRHVAKALRDWLTPHHCCVI